MKNVLLLALILSCSSPLTAQTNCEEGDSPLNRNQPQGIAPHDIIQKFAAQEGVFKLTRDNYTYTQDVTVQTLDGHTVDGEFRQVTDISYDDKGNRVESVTFAPPNTLTRVVLTQEDFDELRNRMPFVLTTEDLPQYDVLYAGTQHLDEIDTYVFDAAPKHLEKDKRYFQGRIWVDDHDFQIVKTCGKIVPDTRDKKGGEHLSPSFVTYREQIDGQYWFPTYARADDILHFSHDHVHIRLIMKYTRYKRFGSKSKIIFKGETPPDRKPK
ncbi:MAG TPA: hypothetical protein VGR03_16095 [Candidatus Acidoferrum sp.]|nr:hypothetical protein [Candidatus Acidoferrum sp.]